MSRPAVICDASFDPHTGRAAIAVTGALGTHTQIIDANTSAAAEARAVLFAMDLALGHGGRPKPYAFLTDCLSLVQAKRVTSRDLDLIRRRLAMWRQWELLGVTRKETQPAHAAAAAAWRERFGKRRQPVAPVRDIAPPPRRSAAWLLEANPVPRWHPGNGSLESARARAYGREGMKSLAARRG